MLVKKFAGVLRALNARIRSIWRDYGFLFAFAGVIFGIPASLIAYYVDLRSLFEPGIEVNVEEVVGAIEENNRTLERMVPSDAIEQLVRRGYTFNAADFFVAGQNGDVESVKLFCAAGGEGFVNPIYFAGTKIFKEQVREVIRECQKDYGTVSCDAINESALREQSIEFLRAILSYDSYYGLATLCNREFKNMVAQLIAEKTNEHNNHLRPICESDLRKIQSRVFNREGDLIALHEMGARPEVKFFWEMLVVNISMEFDINSYECRLIGIDLYEPLKRVAVKVSLQEEIANWP